MKANFILLYVIILTTGIGCKKNNQPDTPVTPKKVVVTTIAGDGTKAFADGPALSAKFNIPTDVAVDSDGIIYVADFNNHRIRKIAAGQVSTFAGDSILDIVNARGASARFEYPFLMAPDANGSLFLSDVGDSRIRKISTAADVSTYAGTSTPGFADAGVAAAQFQIASGGTVADTQGNIYVADTRNQRIRKISISGQVTTIAGNDTASFRDGNGGTALFNSPVGIAIDKQGNLYVADYANNRIRKITFSANGANEVSTFAGSGIQGYVDGNSSVAQFKSIVDIVADTQGNIYVTDDNLIRKISPQGIVSTLAGSTNGYADGDGAAAKFNLPYGLGIDTQGNIYVADTYNHRIRKISFE